MSNSGPTSGMVFRRSFARFWMFLSLAICGDGEMRAAEARRSSESDIVARVDGRDVTVADMRRAYRKQTFRCMLFVRREDEAAYMRDLEDSIIRGLIEDVLLVQEYQRLGRRAITALEAERLREWHRAERCEDDDEETFRRHLEEQWIVDRMRAEYRLRAPPVTDADVERYYEENQSSFAHSDGVHLHVIRLTCRDDVTVKACVQRASVLRDRIMAGESFAAIAREASEDSRRSRGGDWDWVGYDDLRDELAAVVEHLPVGGVSAPIPVRAEVFLLMVEARRPSGTAPLNECRDWIRTRLTTAAGDEAERRGIDNLRARAHIWITPLAG